MIVEIFNKDILPRDCELYHSYKAASRAGKDSLKMMEFRKGLRHDLIQWTEVCKTARKIEKEVVILTTVFVLLLIACVFTFFYVAPYLWPEYSIY